MPFCGTENTSAGWISGANNLACPRGCHEVTGGRPGTKKGAEAPSLYPRAESNRNRQNRNLKFYPLNYKGMYIDAKIDKFIYKR